MVTMEPYKTEYEDQFDFGSSSIGAALNHKVSNNGVTVYGDPSSNLQVYYGTGHTHSASISSDSGASITGVELPSRSHPSINYINRVSQTYGSTIPRQRSQRRDSYRVVHAPTPSHPRTIAPIPNIPVKRESTGSGCEDEDDQELPEPPDEDATEEEKAVYKRRKNTLSARRSRKRKMLQMESLQDSVTRLTREVNEWKERALTMERWLQHNKIPVPNFEGL